MARGVRGRIRVIVEMEEYTDVGTGAGDTVRRHPHPIDYSWEFTSGTTDGTMLDRVWSASSSLTTTPVDLDLLSTSGLPSAMDASFNVGMSDLAVVLVTNEGTSGGGDVVVGGSSAPIAALGGGSIPVGPGGILLLVQPYGSALTATTADLLRVVASTGTVNSKVLVAGRTV